MVTESEFLNGGDYFANYIEEKAFLRISALEILAVLPFA